MAAVNLFTDANYWYHWRWVLVGAGTGWQCTRSYDGAYVKITNVAAVYALGYVDTMPTTDGGAVTMVQYHFQAKITGGVVGGYYGSRWVNAAYSNGPYKVWTAGWTEEASTPATPALTEANINAGAFGVLAAGNGAGGKQGGIDRSYCACTYTPPSGLNFVKFGGALMGAFLTQHDWFNLVNWHHWVHDLKRGMSSMTRWNCPAIHYDRKELEDLKEAFRNQRRAYAC